MDRITCIELQGFQAFRDPVRLELAPITLLYGPNSAGKSAIFDGLELAQQFWDPKNIDMVSLTRMARSWARQEKQVSNHIIKISLTLRKDYFPDPGDYSDGEEEKSPFTRSRRLLIGWDDFTKPLSNGPFDINYSFSLCTPDDKDDLRGPVYVDTFSVSIKDRFSITVQSEHPISGEPIDIDDEFEATRYLVLEDCDAFIAQFIRGDIQDKLRKTTTTSSYSGCIGDNPTRTFTPVAVRSLTGCVLGKPTTVGYWKLAEDQIISSEVHEFFTTCEDVICYFGGLLKETIKSGFPLVKADRRVPDFKDFVTIVNPWSYPDDETRSRPKILNDYIREQVKENDPHYVAVAESGYYSLLKDIVYENSLKSVKPFEQLISKFEAKALVFSEVNELLSKHLFIERGYRIACDALTTVPLNSNTLPLVPRDLLRDTFVSLKLIDDEGRQLAFKDVGSGVGFVLPILTVCALKAGMVLVQQPELHLHPALQASIADVFISGISNHDSQAIVETHSEHFLLRFLKRIRLTYKGVEHEFNLRPEDLAVFYFNPVVGEQTYVIKQGITPLGDFYTDWPKGFFPERLAEYRDE